MRGKKKNWADSSRLVRMPDGRLVSEAEARKLAAQQSVNAVRSPSSAPRPVQQNTVTPQSTPAQPKAKLSRRERKAQYASVDERAVRQKQQTTSSKSTEDKDILEVWNEQERLRKESERLELEYQIAKKMAKDLKRQIKVREQPHESVDEAFKDLLSPEVKDVARKLKPGVTKIKSASKTSLQTAAAQSKKIIRLGQLLVRKIVKTPKYAAITAGVLVVFVGGGTWLANRANKPIVATTTDVQGANTQKIATNQTPEFGVLTPAGKSAEQLGGFARISPPDSAPAYAFKDELGGVPIKVTQQALPEAFKANPSEIENLAKKYNANELIQIDTVSVYSGVSEKGPQTLIFTKEGLLAFIVADKRVDDVQWVQYITNLVKQ